MSENDDDKAAEAAMDEAKFTIISQVELSERMLHDQLVAAIEGGSGYWAHIDVGKHEPGWRNYFTAKFTIHEMGDEEHGAVHGKTYELSIDKLKKGVAWLAKHKPRFFTEIVEETGDASTGDALVQASLFEYLVYG